MFFSKMVLESRKHDHKDMDKAVHQDINAQQDLKICVLYKFWKLGSLRAQPRFLQMLVDYWDPDIEYFQLDGMPLRLEVEYIYFVTRLSHRGEVVSLWAHGLGGGINIKEYIVV